MRDFLWKLRWNLIGKNHKVDDDYSNAIAEGIKKHGVKQYNVEEDGYPVVVMVGGVYLWTNKHLPSFGSTFNNGGSKFMPNAEVALILYKEVKKIEMRNKEKYKEDLFNRLRGR